MRQWLERYWEIWGWPGTFILIMVFLIPITLRETPPPKKPTAYQQRDEVHIPDCHHAEKVGIEK